VIIDPSQIVDVPTAYRRIYGDSKMADIVERLRRQADGSIEPDHSIMLEAADEIESLRKHKGMKAVADMLCPPVPKSIDPTGW